MCGLNFVTISLDSSCVKNQFLGPSRGYHTPPLGPLFLFPHFFLPFFVFFLAFYFSFFSFFVHFFIFVFLMFFILFFIFSEEKVSSFLFSCVSFKHSLLLALVSEFNCFLRSRCAPWGCGVLTAWGGIAGIGLGRLLG